MKIFNDGPATRRLGLVLRASMLALSCTYFAIGLNLREVSMLESQDLGIACDLFNNYALSPDHSPLHFVFMSFWQRLNGTSVAFLRAPSVFFCSVAVLVVFSLVEALAGTLAGIAGAVFMTFNPEVVDVARSMRLYSLVVLSSAMCLWFGHAYLARSKQKVHLFGFAASVLLAGYTHLFALLLAGSVGFLFAVDAYRHRGGREARSELKWAAVVLLLLVPQIVHGLATIAFVHERHGLYRGLPSGALGFLVPIARTLFFGESEAAVPLNSCVILAPGAILALGIASLTNHGRAVVAAIILPAVGVAWLLSHSTPVEPRYLCFLTPAIAVVMGIGAARARNAHLFAPLSVATVWMFHFASQTAYNIPRTDWYDTSRALEALAQPSDAVAVFPGYWAATFRRYAKIETIIPVTFPVDLDRALARGQHLLLVRNSGRYFGNVEALLSERTRYQEVLSSAGRDRFIVYSVLPGRRTPPPPARKPESLLVVGVFGSGGFPWQITRDQEPFHRLRRLFAGSRVVLAAYEPYHPPWYAQPLLRSTPNLEPNTEAIYELSHAGINTAVLACTGARCAADADLLTANGIAVVSRASLHEVLEPSIFQIGDAPIGVFGIRGENLVESTASIGPELRAMVAHARASVGATGRLVAVVQSPPDYGRLATDLERRTARQLIDLGVDVVIGEGGYAAKEVEEYKQGIIAYSLGTLLRPPMMSLAMRESTGLALRLSFRAGARPSYEAIPLTFDDSCIASLADPNASKRLLVPISDSASRSLVDEVQAADSFYWSSNGAVHSLGPFRAEGRCLSSLEQRFYACTAPVTRWFPETPPDTPLRPLEGAFCAEGSYVARRGVLSLGEYRRAIELESGGESAVGLRFKGVQLGNRLSVAYGVPDDRLLSKFLPLLAQRIVVNVASHDVLSEEISYQVGWHNVEIDTTAFSSTTQDISISVHTGGTHFPVAIDAEIFGDKL